MNYQQKHELQLPFGCQILLYIYFIISVCSGVVNFIFQFQEQTILLMIFFYIRLGLCLPAAIGIAILDKGNCCLLKIPFYTLFIYLGVFSLPCFRDKKQSVEKIIFWSTCSRLLFDGFLVYYSVSYLICAARITNCYIVGELDFPVGVWFLYFSAAIDVLSIIGTFIEIVWECCLNKCCVQEKGKGKSQVSCLESCCRSFLCCPYQEKKSSKALKIKELERSEIKINY